MIRNYLKNLNPYSLLIGFLLGVGIVLRVLFLSYGRPLWNDECALALNIQNLINFFTPLTYNQSAPQLFMYLSKIFYYIFPDKTFALRVVPFVSSILSVFVFYNLAKNILVKKFSVFLSVALFSLCYWLCYYAQEFKQYSSDVLIFLLVLLSYFYLEKIVNKTKYITIYTIVAILLLWCSFVSTFAFVTIAVCLFIFKRKTFKRMLIPFSLIFVNVLLLGLANFYLQSNSYLHDYWADAFINKGFYNFLLLNINNMKYAFASGLPFFFIVISIALMLIRNFKNDKTWIMLLPLCLSLILSYFEIYPYSTRVILFLIPVFILLLSKLIDFINFKNDILKNIVIVILCVVTILPVGINSFENIIKRKYSDENIINPLKQAVKLAQKDDIIYVSDGNCILFDYYKSYFNIESQVFMEQKRYNDNEEYVKVLDGLEKGKTYFGIMAHHPDKFRRVEAVYNWAKNKKDFAIYADKKGNSLIKFTL